MDLTKEKKDILKAIGFVIAISLLMIPIGIALGHYAKVMYPPCDAI